MLLPALFMLLCAGLFAVFFSAGCVHTRDVWRNAADRQVVPTTSTTWRSKMLVILAAVICSLAISCLHALYERFAVRGTPRSITELKDGRYRVVYRTSDGTKALVAPINGGEPTYYRLEQRFLGEGEYCFRRSRPDHQPVYTNVPCPPLEQ